MSSDPPIWRGTRPSHGITRIQAYSLRSLKKGECGPLSTGPAGRELKRDGSMVACKGYSPKHKKRRLAEASALKEGGGITPQTVNLRVCPLLGQRLGLLSQQLLSGSRQQLGGLRELLIGRLQ